MQRIARRSRQVIRKNCTQNSRFIRPVALPMLCFISSFSLQVLITLPHSIFTSDAEKVQLTHLRLSNCLPL